MHVANDLAPPKAGRREWIGLAALAVVMLRRVRSGFEREAAAEAEVDQAVVLENIADTVGAER